MGFAVFLVFFTVFHIRTVRFNFDGERLILIGDRTRGNGQKPPPEKERNFCLFARLVYRMTLGKIVPLLVVLSGSPLGPAVTFSV